MAATRYRNEERFFKAFLTQEDMMDFGFSVRFYQRIEAGKPIHMRTVLKLADALDVSLKQLFGKF